MPTPPSCTISSAPKSPDRKSYKRFVLGCVLALLVSGGAHANINDDLTSFFNQMGGQSSLSNGTDAGAFQGQARNLYTGGSFYARLPQQNYNLVNAALPEIKSGCGGIDWFLGSFSHINKEQFVQMLRNVGNGALGYAFELAIDSIDPMIGGVLKDMKKSLESLNNMNIQSCEAGQALVNGMVGKTALAAQHGCSSLGAYLNIFNDRPEGMGECSDPAKSSQVQSAINNNPQAQKAASIDLRSGNLMAMILDDAYPWMAADEKKLLVSMTGTLLVSGTTQKQVKTVAPTIESERDILAGVLGGSASDGYVTVKLLNCIDPEQTSCPDPVDTQVRSLRTLVDQRLTEYETMMRAPDQVWSQNKKDEMTSFVNITSVPIMRMMKMDFSGWTGIRSTYTDLIASSYAIFYLDSMVKQAVAALSNYPAKSEMETQTISEMRSRLSGLRKTLIDNESKNQDRAAAMTQIGLQLAQFDQTLRSNDSYLSEKVEVSRSLGGSLQQ